MCILPQKNLEVYRSYLDLSSETSERTKIEVSNAFAQRETAVNENNCSSLETEVKLKDKANTSHTEKSETTGSIIFSTVYSNSAINEFDKFSSVDDSLEDPYYESYSAAEELRFFRLLSK